MVTNLKGKFIPKDYQLSLFIKMKNLKQKAMTIKEYNEEIYKVNIRTRYVEDNPKKVAKYINGLRFDIQEEMNLLSPNFVEETHQFSLKDEEKLARKRQGKSRESFRVQGPMRDIVNLVKEINYNQLEQSRKDSEDRGRKPYIRGRGGSKGF